MIRISMSREEFQSWRRDYRDRATRQAHSAAPEAYYVRTVGWCGPGWEKAQDAYCASLMGQDRADA